MTEDVSHIKEILDHWKSILKKAKYLLNAAPNMNLLAVLGQEDSKQYYLFSIKLYMASSFFSVTEEAQGNTVLFFFLIASLNIFIDDFGLCHREIIILSYLLLMLSFSGVRHGSRFLEPLFTNKAQ